MADSHPDAIALLKAGHRKVEELFEQFEAGEGAAKKVLSEQIEHHVGEEERPSTGIFSQVRAAGLDMNALGARLAARKKELTAQFAIAGVPASETRTFIGAEVDKSAPVGRVH